MSTYTELKAELLQIGKIIERFPKQVRPKVYDLLIEQFWAAAQSRQISKPQKQGDAGDIKSQKSVKMSRRMARQIGRQLPVSSNQNQASVDQALREARVAKKDVPVTTAPQEK